jgi:hypothetical protein
MMTNGPVDTALLHRARFLAVCRGVAFGLGTRRQE